jgi:ABC-type nitrate/sulfonate/bicarbonate transport system ATPase subunit
LAKGKAGVDLNFGPKSFDGRQVLAKISLSLAEGRILALVGPSGIGKTTLLRMIAGLESDDLGQSGTLRKLGMVFQEPRLMPWLTARENIEIVAPPQDWLSRVGLAGFEDHYPAQLSLGMARRVALARALSIQPELLILDEPFASLDEATAFSMKDLLLGLFEEKPVTAILVSHRLEDAAELADEIAVLRGAPAALSGVTTLQESRSQRDIGANVKRIRKL